MLRAHGLQDLDGAVLATGHGRMDRWGSDDLAARGGTEGDPVTFLVRLEKRDTNLPRVLQVVRLPLFCRAWGEKIGVGPDFPGVTVFDGAGRLFRFFPRRRPPPGSAAIGIGQDPAIVDPQVENRLIPLGTNEWDQPMLTTVGSGGYQERLVVTELMPERLVARRIEGAEFTFKTRRFLRCDPGVPLEALAEDFWR